MRFKRYAIYFTPAPGDFADFGAAWLGWDAVRGVVPPALDVPGLNALREEVTETPRKYGLHATMKPPFRLAEGKDAGALAERVAAMAETLAPVTLDGLSLARLGRFLALVPEGDTGPLNALAAETVRAFDDFRAPLSDEEIAKRRAGGLSPAQDALLLRWGYPYVMESFRFHITLTSKMPKAQAAEVRDQLAPVVDAILPRPFPIDALSLAGEDQNGFFHILHRYALKG